MVRVRGRALLVGIDAVRLVVAADEVYVLSAPRQGRLQHAAAATTDNAFVRDLLFRLRAPPAALLGAGWCARSPSRCCVLCVLAGPQCQACSLFNTLTRAGTRAMRLWTAACPLSCAHWRVRWRLWRGCWWKRLPRWKLMPCLPQTGWLSAYAARNVILSSPLSHALAIQHRAGNTT